LASRVRLSAEAAPALRVSSGALRRHRIIDFRRVRSEDRDILI
jgi:hypothetical protein